ncbi:MAG: FAD-dependent oxidoreductase [Betaproteobacteria bacterium]
MEATAPPAHATAIARDVLLGRLRDPRPWDAVIIGGGATGLGIAVDAAQRGLRVALLERRDFGSGTSSRSTKLIHGGVRYLAQGNVKLVREALAERAVLLQTAPHLVHRLEFIVPCYRHADQLLMRIGLGLYDALAGSKGIGPTRWLSRDETLRRLPGVRAAGLVGGVSYWDGQFDDQAMCMALMRTALSLGATPVDHLACGDLVLNEGAVAGLRATDAATGESFELSTRCVFNAAGVWADSVRRMAQPDAHPIIRVSQGSHLVVDARWLPGTAALLVPKTRDGRVLFIVPYQGQLLIGTTDRALDDAPLEPQPSDPEVEFMLETVRGYLTAAPTAADVRRRFAGLRPLYSLQHTRGTKSISREHAVIAEHGGLITVVGGKWTTYRRMAIDALAAAARAGVLPAGSSRTATLRLAAP